MVAWRAEKEVIHQQPQFYPADKFKEEPSEPATSSYDVTYDLEEADESAQVVQE